MCISVLTPSRWCAGFAFSAWVFLSWCGSDMWSHGTVHRLLCNAASSGVTWGSPPGWGTRWDAGLQDTGHWIKATLPSGITDAQLRRLSPTYSSFIQSERPWKLWIFIYYRDHLLCWLNNPSARRYWPRIGQNITITGILSAKYFSH